MDPPERRLDEEAIAERISQEIGAIHADSYGREPKAVRTYLLDNAVLCEIELDLLKHEELIVGNGNNKSVRDVRKAFQEAIGATFEAAIEHMTGRRVVAFISDTHLAPSFSIEYFRLGEERDSSMPDGPADPGYSH